MIDAEVLKLLNTVLKVLYMAPVELETYASNPANRDSLQSVYEALEGFASRATLPAVYLAYRHGYGMGDQGHRRAVKEANKATAKVRKAFGFNVTRPINF